MHNRATYKLNWNSQHAGKHKHTLVKFETSTILSLDGSRECSLYSILSTTSSLPQLKKLSSLQSAGNRSPSDKSYTRNDKQYKHQYINNPMKHYYIYALTYTK